MRNVKTFWWHDPVLAPGGNFGDLLTPLLMEHFSGLTGRWAPVEDAEFIGIGSVLEHIPPMWQGVIAGAGRLMWDSPVHLYGNRAIILGLRGPLSARGIKGDYALGDPGLLANELAPITKKKYDLGIVPHWSDKKLAHDPRFTQFNPVIIRPDQDPLDVVRTIGECRKIVSSSLHGLIVADSYGIPRRFELTDKFDTEGGRFKFDDYALSISMKIEVGKTQQAHRYTVEDRQHELFDMWTTLGRYL